MPRLVMLGKKEGASVVVSVSARAEVHADVWFLGPSPGVHEVHVRVDVGRYTKICARVTE
jgi:hypothetical protein